MLPGCYLGKEFRRPAKNRPERRSGARKLHRRSAPRWRGSSATVPPRGRPRLLSLGTLFPILVRPSAPGRPSSSGWCYRLNRCQPRRPGRRRAIGPPPAPATSLPGPCGSPQLGQSAACVVQVRRRPILHPAFCRRCSIRLSYASAGLAVTTASRSFSSRDFSRCLLYAEARRPARIAVRQTAFQSA